MNLKENIGGKMGGFERREGEEEMLQLIISKDINSFHISFFHNFS